MASLKPGADSGFALLPVASGDYEARLALIDLSESSIDIQTFYWARDNTGTYLLDRLRAAAKRGVRVRLLIDDLNSAGTDDILKAFSEEANVEVRLFNPFPDCRWTTKSRLLCSLNEFARINHRMHNKLFVVDDAIAIFGGRNTGDEYFMRAPVANFVDFDAIAAGRVVQDLSRSFDEYWNSALAYPVREVVSSDVLGTEEGFRARLSQAEPPDVDETVPPRFEKYTSASTELSSGRLNLVPAQSVVKVDPVDKAQGSAMRDRSATVREFIAQTARQAREEVVIISPYFVPGELGMDAMRQLRARGVHVRVLTNSLASTDEPSVHAGYRRYRRQLLEIGVEIYEISPLLTQRLHQLGRFGKSLGTLHMKIAVIDRRLLFVGSMNLDERSERYNTELGVLIESPVLAADYLDLVRYERSAYRLQISPSTGEIEWVDGQGADARVYNQEPETTWWLRFKSELLGDTVPEGWL